MGHPGRRPDFPNGLAGSRLATSYGPASIEHTQWMISVYPPEILRLAQRQGWA